MNLLIPIAAVALLGLADKRRKSTFPDSSGKKPGPSAAELAERIKREAEEIVHGKRDDFTPVAPALPSPKPTAPKPTAPKPARPIPAPIPAVVKPPKPKPSTEAEKDAAARAAVEEFEKGLPAPRPPRATPAVIPSRPAPRKTGPVQPKRPRPVQPISPPTAAPTTRTATIPPGYDPDGARRMAPSLARHLARAKYNYDRPLLKSFQIKAAIKPDKIYGGGTRGALVYFGAPNAPRPLFKPTQTIPYVPPEER